MRTLKLKHDELFEEEAPRVMPCPLGTAVSSGLVALTLSCPFFSMELMMRMDGVPVSSHTLEQAFSKRL